uniref:Protein Wnt n=1 Tax=Meloidogyne enterolobii TaxID=390850 RepID=A0A6V7XMI5_MELEN|nr:unnamed protein product [Meloidogyne enterolobii]
MLGSIPLGAMRKRWKHPESNDEQSLVYLKNSPNYCEEDAATGSQGECNISSFGTDSCESLCCGKRLKN